MFRSYGTGRAGDVTILANDMPLQDPPGGPNFFMFDDNALYEIDGLNQPKTVVASEMLRLNTSMAPTAPTAPTAWSALGVAAGDNAGIPASPGESSANFVSCLRGLPASDTDEQLSLDGFQRAGRRHVRATTPT